MSDTYYAYRDVKVKIAHRLFKLDGWKVYNYYADNSDPMTDYYDPAYWGGIATKNGFTLVVDHSEAAAEYRRTYTVSTCEASPEVAEKIKKLERMTQANGASEQEEATARAAIEKLTEKKNAGTITKEEYTPGHMANPPRCNWHIEKDGIIIDKGTGLLKFYRVPDISRERDQKEWQSFNNQTPEAWKKEYKNDIMRRWNYSEEEAERAADRAYNEAVESYALLNRFNELIARFNNVCGGMVGNSGEGGYTYEMRKFTKYRKVWKFNPTTSGSFKAGQCFRLETGFNYGCYKGLVYRLETFGTGETLKASRVSMKSGKTLTGTANTSNFFGYYSSDNATENHGRAKEKFLNWISQGAIVWGKVVEVSEPYEVEKAVKVYHGEKPSKATKEATTETSEEATENAYTITADTDTRDNTPLWVVKLSDHVSREKFSEIREEMKEKGGYYSRFKKGFIFREDPTEIFNRATSEATEEAPATEETPATEEAAPEATTEATEEAAQETTEETPEAITAEEPAEEPTAKEPGYTGNTSDLFTPEELHILINGGQIAKGENYLKRVYISTPYKNNVRLMYSMSASEGGEISPGADAKQRGFIYNGLYYAHLDEIRKAAEEDINAAIIEAIPSEEAAEANAVSLDEYQKKQFDELRGLSFEREAKEHFIKGTEPELYLYEYRPHISTEDIINYIVNPAEVVTMYATSYTSTHAADILNIYIRHNATKKALEAIKADPANIAHLLKKINEATKDGSEKTYRIKLANGETVRAEADAVRRLAYCGNISEYYILAADRQKLQKNEYGRSKDIEPADIITISHGSRVIYQATA